VCWPAQGGFPGLPGPGSAGGGGGGAAAGGAGPGGAAPGGVPAGAGASGAGASALAAQSQLPQNGAPQAPGGGGGGGGSSGGGSSGGGSGGGGSPVISAVAFDGFLSDCTARARPPRTDTSAARLRTDAWPCAVPRTVPAVACGSQPCLARVGALCRGRCRLYCGPLLAVRWEPGEGRRAAGAPQQRTTARRALGRNSDASARVR